MKPLILLLLAMPCLMLTDLRAHDSGLEQDHVNVVGVGEIAEEPDQATLDISVNARQPTLLAAKQMADDRYRAVLEVIKEAGIESQFVKATRVNAQPEYEWRNNQRVYRGET
ncbi:MAG: SIMPL domain-containing protein, partial [Gammaproteobacteria bacterium]|nr:SIMPL domain-containing protein [Gammaproteobacteria bacterium]